MALLAEKARRMQLAGIDVVNLTSGEPDFPTPRHIKEAAIKAIEANQTRYTPVQGDPDLLRAVARKFSLRNGLHFEPEQILISNGARQSVFNALQSVCNKGDEVVLIAPHCPDYPEMVRLVEAVPVVVKTHAEKKFKPEARDLRRAINQKTKAILLNSPNNPSGAVYSRSLLEEIASIAKDTGVFIISDEVYEELVFDGAKHVSIGSIKSVRDQVITVNSMSMAFSMSGWRIGYMGGPSAVIESATRFQNQNTFSANSIAQKAALAALTGPTNELEGMVAEFKRRRDFAVEALSDMRDVTVVLPEGTFFVFFRFGKVGRGAHLVKNSVDLAAFLLEEQHVAVSPGLAFGDDRCLRISLACPMTELERGMKRLKAGFEDLK